MELHPKKPDKPLKKIRYHHSDLRNAIIDSVARLIEEKRSLAFQLKEVATLVGTSQPAIYRHFENKAALLVETAVRGYQLQRELREHAIKTTGGTPFAYRLLSGSSPGEANLSSGGP
ncbi:TetR/AcrR family transcriptional regulator [Parasphingorhabdus flavimaris]|uniref:TetR/AcrR family transcriptional regulator n=1 Tax=Parasphingorhabdus flavimaris TaxID=266812 RepID=UPI003002B859